MQHARPGLVVVAFAAAVVILGSSLPGRSRPGRPGSSPPPSVLLITIDTLRADHLGCYGYARIKTPTIDRLASEGVRFENAYAQVPITLPSHAVILTGTYPMSNGVRDFTSPGLPDDVPTLAEIFRRHHYRTAAFVSSFVLNSMWGLNRGFETYNDTVAANPNRPASPFQLERPGDQTVDRMLEWLQRRESDPFFVWLHLYDPHSPYRPPEPYRSQYVDHLYDGEIAFDDAQISRVIARLRQLHLYRNTLVVLLSDHGESLGEHGEDEHGFFIYNATLLVPLILKPPGDAAEGRVIREPVGTVDVAPTIARLCNFPPEETRSFQGRSLLSAPNEPPSENAAVYAESYYPRNSFGWHALRALVTPHLKYIEAPRAELYDLTRDPGERQNIATTDSAAAASLRDRLAETERKFRAAHENSSSAKLDPDTLEKLKSLGYVSYQAGSRDAVSESARADPKDKVSVLNQILRAGDLTRLARNAEADQLLARLEKTEPGLYVVPFQRGENYLAWRKPDRAAPELRRALALNPTFDQAALGLGRAYFLLGQNQQAETAFQLAIQLNPHNFLARLALARVYWGENRLDEAEAELAQVTTTHPESAEAHAEYGIVLAKLAKYKEGAAEIKKGIELGYRDAIAYNYLGVALAQLGDRPNAIRAYEQAVALNSRYAAAYLNLALQYRSQGEVTNARSYFRRVCEISGQLCQRYADQFSEPNPRP